MRIYIINLAKRPDRRKYIDDQLKVTALDYVFVDAVDAQTTEFASSREAAKLTSTGPWGEMSNGTLACTLSHFKVLAMIAESPAPYGLVLEDDVQLSLNFPALVRQTHAIPADAQIVRIEHWNDPKQVIVFDRTVHPIDAFELRRLRSRTAGSAGYIISREFAKQLVQHKQLFNMPMDHALFNPVCSRVTRKATVYQLLPGVVVQDPQWGSNISAIKPATSLSNRARGGWYEVKSSIPPLLRVLRRKGVISKSHYA